MAQFTNAQLQNLLGVLPYSRNGIEVPGTGFGSILNPAACWSWALTGTFTPVDSMYGAQNFYNSIVNRDIVKEPIVVTGLNRFFVDQVLRDAPATRPFIESLRRNLPNAIVGNPGSRMICKLELMKIIITLNGMTVLNGGMNNRYVIHMRTNTWHSWDHWGVSVMMNNNAGPMNYIQKVPDQLLYCRASLMWDEGMPLASVGVDGLLDNHINILHPISG